jgi:hypothetical protein
MALTLSQHNDMMMGAPALLGRFRAARDVTANAIISESAQTEHHTERMAWATKIKSDYNADTQKEYSWCLTWYQIQALSDPITQTTDEHLTNAVSGLMPTLAGY